MRYCWIHCGYPRPVLAAGVVLLMLAVGLSCARSPAPPVSPLVGRQAPEVELSMLDGEPFSLDAHRGQRVVMLDFWATWCPPCVEELPMLEKIYQEFRDEDFAFVAINQGETAQEVAAFLKNRDLDIPTALDPDQLAGRSFGLQGIPVLVLVDRQGVIRAYHEGYAPELETELREQIRELLKTEPL